jgi:RNA polymerase sigma factor (sigma-70 family)
LLGSIPEAALTDGQLLDRFLAHRDEAAVEVLIRRYGPLVLGVCRRVLHNRHAAEDAFQATFLVLTRKASSLDRAKPLGSWLYTVAYRLALSARANEFRRQHREAEAVQRRLPAKDEASSASDLAIALEEELQKLPPRHRLPLVLCYLEGKTNDQAAQALGCPRGSMAARLDQARERLRQCLARRGFVASSTAIAAALATASAQAAVPLPLLANTVRAASWFVGEQSASAGFISAGAVALARAVCRATFLHKMRSAAAVLLVTAMVGTGATMLLKAGPPAGPDAQAPKQPSPEAQPDRAETRSERLPIGAVARMGSTRLRHGDTVYFATYTPDGQALLTAGNDQTVRLWDVATGKEKRRFDWGEELRAAKAQPSPDGLAEKRLEQFWHDMARSCQVALSRDGKVVAASRGGAVCLWATASGNRLRRLQTGQKRLIQLAFSADGKSLLTLGPGRATAVWQVATGKCVQSSQGEPESTYFATLGLISDQATLVSPGFKYLAAYLRDKHGNPWISICDFPTGKQRCRIAASAGTMALTLSANGKSLAWDDPPEGGIVISDLATGKELRRLRGDARTEDPVMALAFSPDGKSLAVSRLSHSVDLWDLTSGRRISVAGKVSNAQFEEQSLNWLNAMVRPALAFSPDSKKLVASLGGPTIRQFRVDTGEEIAGPGSGPQAPVSTLALSPDGKSLRAYSTGDQVRSWDWSKGKATGQRGVPASATYAVFGADGRVGYVADHHFTLCGPAKGSDPANRGVGKITWKVADASSPLVALTLSPDGALLATRNFLRPEVHLWDTAKGKKRLTLGPGHENPEVASDNLAEATGVLLPYLVSSPDGRYLAASGPSRQLCLWDTATGALLWEVLPLAGQAIERFAFSPSGELLASVYADGTVMLYETVTGAPRARLGEPTPKNRRLYLVTSNRGPVNEVLMRRDAPVCLAFSADGRYLATAQHTPEIRLWHVLAGREVGQLKGHEGGVVSLLFAPQGKYLFSGGYDTTVLTWDVTRMTRGTDWQSVLRKSGGHTRMRPQDLNAQWTDLAGRDAARAFAAIRKLCACPNQAVTFIKHCVRPVAAPDPQRLTKLLADLASDRFESRRLAEAELLRLGDQVEPALRQALADDPPLDLRQRLERLLKQSGNGPPAEILRDLRAVEVLELIGGPDARRVLQGLASGMPGARLTRQARAASKRLTDQAINP